MFVPFNSLPPTGRIWIYQANRELSSSELQIINEKGRSFIDQWGAHGHPLKASLRTNYNHFIIISVDNHVQLPSGCSIDQSVDFIRSLETEMKIDLFDRTKVAFWQNEKVHLRSLADTKKEIQQGTLDEDAMVFNNLITKISELPKWIVPLKNSWLARYITQTTR